jgi:transcriptional regulator of arginine metabolism
MRKHISQAERSQIEKDEINRGTKEKRHQVLRSLINDHQMGTQGELVKLLKKEGFRVTQSSISRDLEELGVIKAHGYYALPSSLGAGPVLRVLSIRSAGDALIVLRSEPGFASAISAEIDRHAPAGIVGTLAGDDTIFIAVSGRAALMRTIESLERLFPH